MKNFIQHYNLNNKFDNVAMTLKLFFGILLALTVLISCDVNDDGSIIHASNNTPTSDEFSDIRKQALENITQHFQFNADDGYITLTSANGVTISLNGNCLTKSGNPVTGFVDLEYVEIFERGNMLTTNKPTMGILPNNDQALLVSGGEFFLEATQNGIALETNCSLNLTVPASLTGAPDEDMILWTGVIDENGDLVWEEAENDGANQVENNVFVEGASYYALFGEFGWTNIDRFYNDPRPKTTIQAQVPVGYNADNSAVYLSYDGEDSGLARLDTYDETTGLFSEHYGQIPIGLECHVIFATEDNGNWRYATKAVTIAANDIITFTLAETAIATETELISIINNLP
ncbi:hypothetical protein ACW5R3_13575 [Bizionia sp. KMM 8389]